MSTIVQDRYPVEIVKGRPGTIADSTDEQTSTYIVETAGGIPFGRAVSKGTSGDRAIVLGGSAFVGITVTDITLDRVPLDPLNTGVYADVDTYPHDYNAGVISRGHVWVEADASVTAGNALYYDTTTGKFSNSASGLAAHGKVTFTQQPDPDDTITINALEVTFKASGATGDQVNIGDTLNQTLLNLVAYLNAETDVKVANLLTFAAYPTGGANELHISADVVGVTANDYVIATTVDGATIEEMDGGTASATAITGGYWFTSALAGEPAIVSLAIQR